MFSLASKSRKSTAILSAGAAAALLLTGLGVSRAVANNLQWNPGLSTTGGTDGTGSWNASTSNWYDPTAATNPVAWNNGDGAYIGNAAASGSYTITLDSAFTVGSGATTSPYDALSISGGATGTNYTLNGSGASGSAAYTLTVAGRIQVNGNLSLQNITVDNTSDTQSGVTTTPYVSNGGTLNIGSGATLAGNFMAAGSYGGSGVINVNNGGTLSGYTNIYVNSGNGSIGSALNVYTGGTVTEPTNFKNLFLSYVTATPVLNGNSGTVNVDGGTMTVGAITVLANNYNQIGTININGGSVTCLAAAAITNKSSSSVGSQTVVNLNGGTLSANWITSQYNGDLVMNFNGGTLQSHTGGGIGAAGSAYTIPTNLNVQAGGAVVDSNGKTFSIESPLLHDASLGSTPDGGLTVENNKATGVQLNSYVELYGANTYTGPTVVNAGGNLVMGAATTVTTQGSVVVPLAAASILNSSSLTIDQGGVLTLGNYSSPTQVNALNMNNGNINVEFNANQVSELVVNPLNPIAASVSGTENSIWITGGAGATTITDGTYTVVSDTAGGLAGGSWSFQTLQNTAVATLGHRNWLLTLSNTDKAVTLSVTDDLTWDTGATPAAPVDGTGTWDTTSALWSNGISDVAWNNATESGAMATFGANNGTAGTVTLGANIQAGALTFNAATSGNYTIAGNGSNTLELTGSTIIANANATLAANTTFDQGLNLRGGGTLTLAGSDTSNGATVIQAGSLALAPGGTLTGTTALTIASGAALNLANTSAGNGVVIDYGSNPSPNSAIQSYVASGAITTSAGYAVGYANGADGVVSGLSAGQEKIMATLPGDTNLAGT
ncbi:MAG: beta strand repeat-containing protein, partial [Phycisphaerae bacterium]